MADDCNTNCTGSERPIIDGAELSSDGDRTPHGTPNVPEYTLQVRNLEQED